MVNYIPKNIPYYPTDHCGVLKVNPNLFNAHFVKFMLKSAGEKAGFSRSYRASIDRVKSLTIPQIPLSEQDSIMEKVEKLQNHIKNLEVKINNLEIMQSKIVKDAI